MCRSVARVSAVRQNKLEKGWLAASFGYVAADGIINFVLCKLCSGPWPGGGEVTQLQAAVSMLYNLCVIRAAPGKCQNWWPLIFLRIALDRRLQPRRYSANSDPASCAFSWTILPPAHYFVNNLFDTISSLLIAAGGGRYVKKTSRKYNFPPIKNNLRHYFYFLPVRVSNNLKFWFVCSVNWVLSAVFLQPFFHNSLLFAQQTLFGLVLVNGFRTIGKKFQS